MISNYEPTLSAQELICQLIDESITPEQQYELEHMMREQPALADFAGRAIMGKRWLERFRQYLDLQDGVCSKNE